MSKVIRLKKGLDIKLAGTAEKILARSPEPESYAVCPGDFKGVTPKLLVSEGEQVKAGTPLFFDKENPEILFTSPVSGTVGEIERGEKRKILAIKITPDGRRESEKFSPASDAGQAKALLLASGLWPALIQRPFGVIAKSTDTPRDIFISGMDTAPLAPDMAYAVRDQRENVEAGVALLSKLTPGKVHLTIGAQHRQTILARTADKITQMGFGSGDGEARCEGSDYMDKVRGAKIHRISGKHPAGNVGVQIANIAPLAKGETVWTVDLQHVAIIGRLARTGRLDMSKTVALAGSEIKRPRYYRMTSGAAVAGMLRNNIKEDGNPRVISGNPLTGTKTGAGGYIGFYDNMVSVIPEGDHSEFIGWAMPRLGKFSFSHTYFSWLTPWKRYRLDTNLNGGERAFVMNGIYQKVFPMPYIYPVYLLKAAIAGDVDKMEKLGIYEVIEEDVALCEFICPSKIEWQEHLRKGIELMIKEL